MPTIDLKINQLEKLLDKQLNYETLQYDLQWISLDIDNYDKENETIKVEFNPNRPDFSSPEGIARLLKGYYGIEKGLPHYEVKQGKEIFKVSPKVRKVRPFVVSGLIRFENPLNEQKLVSLMHMQEVLHWIIGRDRKKVAIGIHDYEAVKGPYRYTTVKPDGIKFRPLQMEAYEMTPKDILEEHPKGIKYAHLINDHEEYPIIYDADGKVVSLPPIINGVYTTVEPNKTKTLFLDLTGTKFSAVNDALNILATTFGDMGGSIETVKVVYEDDLENPIITPNLKPNEWEVDYEYINDYIGVNLNVDEMIKCFQKVRLDAKKSKQDSNILKVQVPAYRNDIMHDVDFVEEVAMGYGYKNIPKVINKKGFGQYHPIQELLQHSRDIMIGSGCIEMVNNILISQKDHKAFNLPFDEKHNITPANPVSVHYNAIRTWLLVGLMNNLKFNRSAEKPFRLFEVGDVIHLDTTQDTMSRRVPHLACIVHSDSADYTVIKSILDHYFRTLGVFTDVKFKPVKHDSFIPGRTAEIFYKSKAIGIIGEIHPQIIINFGLEYPTSAFEINLTPFLEKKSDG